MTLPQAIASLLAPPATPFDWYLSTAAQGTHVAFGVCAFIGLAFVVPRLWAPHRAMVIAMLLLAMWEATSLAVYGGSWSQRLANALFMASGTVPGYATWQHDRRLAVWAVVAILAALAATSAAGVLVYLHGGDADRRRSAARHGGRYRRPRKPGAGAKPGNHAGRGGARGGTGDDHGDGRRCGCVGAAILTADGFIARKVP